jgi:hypothetical protein
MAAMLPGVASAAENADKVSCKDGDWTEFVRADGSAFKNQGDCVNFAAQGGTPLSPVFQVACDRAGGTVVEVVPPTCEFDPPLDPAAWDAAFHTFGPSCFYAEYAEIHGDYEASPQQIKCQHPV